MGIIADHEMRGCHGQNTVAGEQLFALGTVSEERARLSGSFGCDCGGGKQLPYCCFIFSKLRDCATRGGTVYANQ